jgi:hypothetical protein
VTNDIDTRQVNLDHRAASISALGMVVYNFDARVDSQFQYQFPRLAGRIAYTCTYLQVPTVRSDRRIKVPLHAAVHGRLWVCDISDRQGIIDKLTVAIRPTIPNGTFKVGDG